MSSDIPTVSENETSANRIAVNDANLFIDLCEIDLVEIFFELPLEFHTTQLILNELEEDQLQRLVPFIAQKQLSVRHLTQSEIDNLASISTQSRKLSREDLSLKACEIFNFATFDETGHHIFLSHLSLSRNLPPTN